MNLHTFLQCFSPAATWQQWASDSITWLQPAGNFSLAVVLVGLCVGGWLLNFLTLPGNWIGVGLVALYAWLGPSEGRLHVGMGVAFLAFGIALVGELVEFFAGAVGAQQAGASRKSTLYAMVGSIVGAIAGAVIGIPIPVIGPAVAAILFGGAGATVGAMLGEWSDGKRWRDSWVVGQAAFWGRTLGMMGKLLAGLGILLVILLGLVV